MEQTELDKVKKVEMVYMDDGLDKMREMFLNKEVKIYPGDTYRKNGVVVNISKAGVIFHITFSKTDGYEVGKLRFISFERLQFELV